MCAVCCVVDAGKSQGDCGTTFVRVDGSRGSKRVFFCQIGTSTCFVGFGHHQATVQVPITTVCASQSCSAQPQRAARQCLAQQQPERSVSACGVCSVLFLQCHKVGSRCFWLPIASTHRVHSYNTNFLRSNTRL